MFRWRHLIGFNANTISLLQALLENKKFILALSSIEQIHLWKLINATICYSLDVALFAFFAISRRWKIEVVIMNFLLVTDTSVSLLASSYATSSFLTFIEIHICNNLHENEARHCPSKALGNNSWTAIVVSRHERMINSWVVVGLTTKVKRQTSTKKSSGEKLFNCHHFASNNKPSRVNVNQTPRKRNSDHESLRT